MTIEDPDNPGLHLFTFSKILPVPKIFEGMVCGGATVAGEQVDRWFDEKQPDGSTSRQLTEAEREQADKTGCSDPLDWKSENWGTQWNACRPNIRIEDDEVVVHFETAWAPPMPIINELCRRLPNLSVDITFADQFELDKKTFARNRFKGSYAPPKKLREVKVTVAIAVPAGSEEQAVHFGRRRARQTLYDKSPVKSFVMGDTQAAPSEHNPGTYNTELALTAKVETTNGERACALVQSALEKPSPIFLIGNQMWPTTVMTAGVAKPPELPPPAPQLPAPGP